MEDSNKIPSIDQLKTDFLWISKVYVRVDAQIEMPEQQENQMKALIMYYLRPDQFYLYFDDLKQFLIRTIKYKDLDMSKCPSYVL